MRRLTTTVSVITSEHNGTRYGMTATAVTSVCAEPAALLVCINTASSLHVPLLASERFCVNMLQVDQHEISTAFAGKLKGEQRFSAGDWRQSEEGLPFLFDAQANLFCSLEKSIEFGTHRVFIGGVHRVLISENISPLLYEDGKYARSVALA
ncbi:flavin reductase [Rhizobium sp. KVB221]|uniref:Flavin reductase n=2 Tax=Rhizobium setariae TaxID=2801340 RepID=A0A936YK80_9HYPH|nr:flavin reductase [Rhizobium setariae]